MSVTLACAAFGISESCYCYHPQLQPENVQLVDWLVRITDNHRAWGFGLSFLYVSSGERLSFQRVPPPTVSALEKLVRRISERVGRVLERQGLLVRDFESTFLTLGPAEFSDFDDLLGHSIIYRVALGPQRGRKAFTLQTAPAVASADDNSSVAKAAGCSLHAGVARQAHEREKLERLCRYIARPAVSTERLS